MASAGAALTSLREVFRLPDWRPGQAEVVEAQIAGRDTLTVAPTGSGKSVSYWIPSLLAGGVTVVVSPLIALMKDQVDRLVELGVAAAFVNSSLDRAAQQAILGQAAAGGLKLLYVAPERLSRPGFLAVLRGLKVARIVVDEAHCISTWGHDFRPDYRLIGRAIEACGRPPVSAFTATATPQVREDIVRSLGLRDPSIHVSGFNRPNLRLEAIRCRNDQEKIDLLRARLDPGQGRALVYAGTVKAADELAERIRGWGFPAAAYHARLGDEARRRVQDLFAAGELKVVAATVAFGMGVDLPDIRQVIHFHLPSSVEGYYQEAGRAGRDGLPATCLLLWRSGDRDLQAFLIERTFEEAARAADVWADGDQPDPAAGGDREVRRQHAYAKLQLCLSYAQLRSCRHARIADYFGQAGTPRTCQACDNCLAGPRVADKAVPPEAVRAALEAVRRLNGRLGGANLAAILAGQPIRWVREHDWVTTLPQFGSMPGWSQERARALLSELLELGLIGQSAGEYPVLVLTPAGNRALSGDGLPEVGLPEAQPARSAAAARGSGAAVSPAEGPLFERLRRWRREQADERSVPAYVVFSDRTLAELAAARPQSRTALLAVPGVGPAKLEMYGDAVLAVIASEADAAPQN